MRRNLCVMALSLTLSACSYLQVHKMDIDQGNYLSETTVAKIHMGMTKAEVIDILGEPVIHNTFAADRLDYVYTFKPGYGPLQRKALVLIFKNDRVVEIR